MERTIMTAFEGAVVYLEGTIMTACGSAVVYLEGVIIMTACDLKLTLVSAVTADLYELIQLYLNAPDYRSFY
jgi:hypothetical protein